MEEVTEDKLESMAKELNNVCVSLELQYRRAKEQAEQLQRQLDQNTGALAAINQLMGKNEDVEETEKAIEELADEEELEESEVEEVEEEKPEPKKPKKVKKTVKKPKTEETTTEEIEL